MLNITKVNNSIKVEGTDNQYFPDNGELSVPLNSVILVVEEDSDIVTFRSAANNNVYFSAHISQIRIAGAAVTKNTIISAWGAIANSSSGGGGGGGDYDELVQMINNETTARINADAALDTKIDTTNSNAVKATVSGTTLNLNTIAV